MSTVKKWPSKIFLKSLKASQSHTWSRSLVVLVVFFELALVNPLAAQPAARSEAAAAAGLTLLDAWNLAKRRDSTLAASRFQVEAVSQRVNQAQAALGTSINAAGGISSNGPIRTPKPPKTSTVQTFQFH